MPIPYSKHHSSRGNYLENSTKKLYDETVKVEVNIMFNNSITARF